jgi:hypothetical protein
MIIVNIFASIFWFCFFYFLIRLTIIDYKNTKELKRHFGKDFFKLSKIRYERVIRTKICTQTQAFKINEKEIICNFECDGNCQLLNK